MEYINYTMLKEGVDCSYEIGIWSEIESFMAYNNKKVVKYKNNYLENEEKYLLEISLKDYSKENALNLFHKLVLFLEYNCLTLYTKEFYEDRTVFNLFSKSLDNFGFFIEITIL
ncbi:hypothetical protein ACWN83_07760 [Pseudolactococcus plantarum]|uniref:hypothetical protein n=1 Tax=Pseudolactococcus plantarum TaxID=1365 RepID=UPI000ABDFA12|nr:hypothetical protein [Lactococcus plantarum]HCN75528.1 hypothetical protein [Lactococcus sp.]